MPKVLLSQRVVVAGRRPVVGVVEAAPAFLNAKEMNKAAEIRQMFVDTGLPEKELRKLVEVGDTVVLDRGFAAQGDARISKAFDDRVGCYVLIEAMKKLKDKALPVDVYAVGTAQEEVGLRGTARNIRPDIGVALDVTGAFDTPGVAEHEQVTRLGGGVAIKISDMCSISNHGIVGFMRKLAVKHHIKHQLEVLPFGGTDAGGMQLFGAGPVCTLSIPTRYMHSPNEMVSGSDVDAAVDLLARFLENAGACKLEF